MKLRTFLIASCSLIVASTASAQVLINQSKALAGDVTAGDAPGFPVQLKEPGNYKLTSDLVVPQGQKGVLIESAFVTLDLNGFSIRSTNHCVYAHATLILTCPVSNQSEAHGVVSPNFHTVIRNGRIWGFSGHGIHGYGGERLEDLMVYANGRYGYVGNSAGTGSPPPGHIVGSRFFSNGHSGAYVKNTVIERSQFSYNAVKGVMAWGGTVIDSMFVGNQSYGLQAGEASRPTTLKGSTWHDNAGGAISSPGNARSLGGNFDGAAVF